MSTKYTNQVTRGNGFFGSLTAKALTLAGVVVTPSSMFTAVAVHNASGVTIPANSLVYLSGWNAAAGKFNVTLADADTPGRPALLVVTASILDGASGSAQAQFATAANLNTNAAGSVGDPVYLSTTPGGWTLTAPTAINSMQQVVGYVGVKSATVGVIEFNLLGSPLVKIGSGQLQDGAGAAPKWTYDATVQSGAQGTVAMAGPSLPVGTIAVAGFLRVITPPVGVGASIAIQLQGANDIVTAAAISGAPWSSAGTKAIIPVWADLTKSVAVATTAKIPSLVITAHDLSACVLNLFLEAFPADG